MAVFTAPWYDAGYTRVNYLPSQAALCSIQGIGNGASTLFVSKALNRSGALQSVACTCLLALFVERLQRGDLPNVLSRLSQFPVHTQFVHVQIDPLPHQPCCRAGKQGTARHVSVQIENRLLPLVPGMDVRRIVLIKEHPRVRKATTVQAETAFGRMRETTD